MLLAAVWGLTKDRRLALRVAGWSGIAIGFAFAAVAVWSLANGDVGMGIFTGYIAMVLITTGRGMDAADRAPRSTRDRGASPTRCDRRRRRSPPR